MHAQIRGWALALAVFVGTLAGGGTAVAQGEGVHVDPKTPAGKEYALPLEQARRDAAPPGSAATSDAGAAAPLFGAGISRKQSAGGNKKDGKASKGGGGGARGSGSGSVQSGSVAAAVAERGSGMSSGFLTLLIALGVLGVGLAVGLSLRALRAPNQPD